MKDNYKYFHAAGATSGVVECETNRNRLSQSHNGNKLGISIFLKWETTEGPSYEIETEQDLQSASSTAKKTAGSNLDKETAEVRDLL